VVARIVLSLLGAGVSSAQQPPTCYALAYDSLGRFAALTPDAALRMFPSTLRLGPGKSDYANMLALPDTAGRWGAPLTWNTYRLRGDSIVAWLADGNREIRIRARRASAGLDGTIDVTTDEAGLHRVAHLMGRVTQCPPR